MYCYLYQITNLVNGKIYVGVHKTQNLDDGYMGSGKALKLAQNKYGLENFEKKILETFETPEEMYLREAEIVDFVFVERPDTYNIREGGKGGFNLDVSSKGRRTQIDQRIGIFSSDIRTKLKEYANSDQNKDHLRSINSLAQTEEAKLKRKETLKAIKHSQGEKNSQFGTMWITNGVENKKVRKDDPIPDGWKKGRSMGA